MARALLILLSLACAFMIMLPTSSSAAVPPPDVLYYRPYSALFDLDKFWISSSPVGQFNKGDRYDLGFENGTLWVKYWYFSEQYQMPDWWFEVTLKELVEFWDNGDGRFDSSDTVISTLNLTGHDYTFSRYEDDPTDVLTATHSSNRMQLKFTLTERPHESEDMYALPLPLDGQIYTQMPTEVLMQASLFRSDYNITNASFALISQTHVITGYSVLYQQHLTYTELNVTDGNEGGCLRWSTMANNPLLVATTATYDTVNLTVVYPPMDILNHAFLIGVNSLAPSSGITPEPDYTTEEATAYGMGIFIAIGIIAVAIFITYLWRKRALEWEEEVIER